MPSAQMLPMKATPNADIGILNHEPTAPTTMPRPNSLACVPPWSPALMASAAATPGGQAPVAGNTELPNRRYSM